MELEKKIRKRAILIVKITVWLGLLFVDILQFALPVEGVTTNTSTASSILFIIIAYIIIGFPAVYIFCEIIGRPIWKFLYQMDRFKPPLYFLAGALVAAGIWPILGFPFIQDFEFRFQLLDFLTTVLIGSLAGWFALLAANQLKRKLEDQT